MTYGNGKAENYTVIRCWPADGDHVKFFPSKCAASGVATVSIAYSLGADFHSCPATERVQRVKDLYKLLQMGLDEVAEEICQEFRKSAAPKLPGEESIKATGEKLTGEKLKARLGEIDRKQGKQSPIVQGGLPSLGKRQ
jgi:hypothetical protein